MQSYREAERIIERWEESRLTPPECMEEPIQECDYCGAEATHKVGNEYFCEDCLLDTFRI